MPVNFAFVEDQNVVAPEEARVRRQAPVPPASVLALVEPEPELVDPGAALEEAVARGDIPRGASRDFFGGVDRLGVNHALRIGGAEFSAFLTRVSVREGMNEDTEMILTLDNEDFQLNDRRQLSEGHIVELSLFDGQIWRTFEQLKILEVERTYEGGGTIKLTARSRAVDLQYCDHSHVWKDVTDSQVVREIADHNNLAAKIDETSLVHEEVALGNEPAATLLNKLAERNGYEWGVDGKRLFFTKPKGVTSAVVLTYRPDTALPGSIISAGYRKKEDSKSGPKAKAKVSAVNFTDGTVDPDTMTELSEDSSQYTGCNGTGTTRLGKDDPLKQQFEPRTRLIDKGRPGIWEPIPPGEVRDDTVARSIVEAAARADSIDRTNAYIHELEIQTYGMVDIRIRSIIRVVGLSRTDDGKWLVTNIRHEYTSGEAYRMTLSTKAPDKPDGGKGDANPIDFQTENDDQPGERRARLLDKGIFGQWKRDPVIPEKGLRPPARAR